MQTKPFLAGLDSISVVAKDRVAAYLPTTNVPATDISTVYQVPTKSLHIKEETLCLQSIVVVFDQALYAKAVEIKWKHGIQFNAIVLSVGEFFILFARSWRR